MSLEEERIAGNAGHSVCSRASDAFAPFLPQIIERVVEDISFNAPDRAGQEWVITREVS